MFLTTMKARVDALEAYVNYEAELIADLADGIKLSGYVFFRTNPNSPEIELLEIGSDFVEIEWTEVSVEKHKTKFSILFLFCKEKKTKTKWH